MYIAQAFKGLYDWWRYVLGVFIIFAAWQFIGMVPLGIAIVFKLFGTNMEQIPTDIPQMIELLGSNLFLFLMLISFAFGLVGVFVSAKALHKQSVKNLTTARDKIDWKRFWFIFFLWGIVSSGFVLLDYALKPEDYQFNFQLQPFLILAVIAILLIPLQTSFEEYFFRGYLMQGLGVMGKHQAFPLVLVYLIIVISSYLVIDKLFVLTVWYSILDLLFFLVLGILLFNSSFLERIYSTSVYQRLYGVLNRSSTPLLITSIGFGLMHLANPEVEKLGYIIMVYYIGTGLFLGIITLMDDGLELALGFHAANNLFTALLVTADWTAFQTHSILKDLSDPSEMAMAEIFVPVLVVFPILIFILSKLYKWNNWKEKLFGTVVEPPKEDYKILE